jgi:NAD(P)-dependent dehydrogenase (short-subunit alcohol dehydrogenase family)
MDTHATTRPRALITGAAKRVGAIIAAHLAQRGYDIVLHYRHSTKEAEQLAEQLRAFGAEVTLWCADLADLQALPALCESLPPCDVLVNNASIFMRDTVATMDTGALETHMRVNMMAPLMLIQAFAAALPSGRAGHVIMLSDGIFGWSMSPYFFSYAASKCALDSCVDLLAAALAPAIRVNSIALGPTLENANDTPELFARLAARAPLQQNSMPDDVVRTLDYLLDSPTVTGQIFSIASGMNLQTTRMPSPVG